MILTTTYLFDNRLKLKEIEMSLNLIALTDGDTKCLVSIDDITFIQSSSVKGETFIRLRGCEDRFLVKSSIKSIFAELKEAGLGEIEESCYG